MLEMVGKFWKGSLGSIVSARGTSGVFACYGINKK
jgi:hypothetical protein